jgi:hypothetical protein
MILLGRVHHAFQRVDATKPHLNLVAGKLLEALRYLIADQEVVRRLLLRLQLLLGRFLLLYELILVCLQLLLRRLLLCQELKNRKPSTE